MKDVKKLRSFANALKIAAHRAAVHVQDDKDRSGDRQSEYDRYRDRRVRREEEVLDSDLNWLLHRHEPDYHTRLREQQSRGKRQIGDKGIGRSPMDDQDHGRSDED